VTALALAEVDGQPVFVSAGRDNVVRVWRLTDSELLWERLTAFRGVTLTAVALAHVQDHCLIAVSDSGGRVRTWDWNADSGGRQHDFEGLTQEMAILPSAHSPRLVTTHREGPLRMWEALTGVPMDRCGVDAAGLSCSAVATIDVDGQSLLVACGEDGIVRSWSGVAVDTGWRERFSLGRPARHLALAAEKGHILMAAYCAPEEWEMIYELATGRCVSRLALPNTGVIDGLSTVTLPQGPALVLSFLHLPGPLQVWSMTDGEVIRHTFDGEQRQCVCAATGVLCGRPVIVASRLDARLDLFDVLTGTVLEPPCGTEPLWLRALALTEVAGELVIACGTSSGRVELWCAGRQIGRIETDGALRQLVWLPPHGLMVAATEGLMLIQLPGLWE
jgi:hypothetical protein